MSRVGMGYSSSASDAHPTGANSRPCRSIQRQRNLAETMAAERFRTWAFPILALDVMGGRPGRQSILRGRECFGVLVQM